MSKNRTPAWVVYTELLRSIFVSSTHPSKTGQLTRTRRLLTIGRRSTVGLNRGMDQILAISPPVCFVQPLNCPGVLTHPIGGPVADRRHSQKGSSQSVKSLTSSAASRGFPRFAPYPPHLCHICSSNGLSFHLSRSLSFLLTSFLTGPHQREEVCMVCVPLVSHLLHTPLTKVPS